MLRVSSRMELGRRWLERLKIVKERSVHSSDLRMLVVSSDGERGDIGEV